MVERLGRDATADNWGVRPKEPAEPVTPTQEANQKPKRVEVARTDVLRTHNGKVFTTDGTIHRAHEVVFIDTPVDTAEIARSYFRRVGSIVTPTVEDGQVQMWSIPGTTMAIPASQARELSLEVRNKQDGTLPDLR